MGFYKRICRQCGISFQGGPRAGYCPECRLQRKAETTANYRERKRAGKVREIGSIDICQNCGEKYIVNSGLQMYCKKCAPEMIKESDRHQGIEYYRKNKDKINPARNASRRLERYCEKCGTKISAAGGRRWCGKCEKFAKKNIYTERYESRNITRSGNSYIVRVFFGGKTKYIKCTTDKEKAYKMRNLAEQKIKDGIFEEWFEDFKSNGRDITGID